MTDFTQSPRALDLEARVRRFIDEVVIPYESDPRCQGPLADEVVQELRRHARAAGLLAPQVGAEWGGHGLDHRDTAVVLRASGYSLLGPVAMNCMAPDEGNMHMLERIATPAQKERFLRPLAAGTLRSSFLMTEPDGGAGSDPGMMLTRAVERDDHWVIDGRKWFITGAEGAGVAIVMARTDDRRATMFLVPLPDPGVRIERIMHTVDHTMPGGHAVVALEGVRVPKEMVLGEPHEGFRYAQVRLAPARLTHCMRWWGAALRAHHVATGYAARRQAFGKPLIDHEGVGFQLARNEIDLLQSRLMIDHAAWLLDQGERASAASSMAKVACSEMLFQVVDRCVQVMGGSGIVDETPVSKIWREIRAFRVYDGPTEVHLHSLAKRLQRDSPQNRA
ncbi:MAG: acyl-CoA dehydrogenase [Gammaproteobacteria bacterium]|nr:acyl-CoA dehydrogenase [Gammaproteobacteria bacterium]